MEDYITDRCPICSDHREPFTNTAGVTGRYNCSSGCRGDISAVSAPTVTEIVDVTLDKTVRPACVRPGQTVRYTITLCNNSSVPVSQILVTDPEIEEKLEVGTIYYNGRPVSGSLCRGIRIPGIGAGCCAAITFDATVPARACGEITNTAYANFEFDSAACGRTLDSAASNEVVLNVVSPSLEITKAAEPCAVTREESEITYTLTARNTGTCPIEDVVVTDTLPAGLTYVPGSTSIRGGTPVDLNPALGVRLGTLNAGQSAGISFRAEAEF